MRPELDGLDRQTAAHVPKKYRCRGRGQSYDSFHLFCFPCFSRAQHGFNHGNVLRGFLRRVPMRRAFADGSCKCQQFIIDAFIVLERYLACLTIDDYFEAAAMYSQSTMLSEDPQ